MEPTWKLFHRWLLSTFFNALNLISHGCLDWGEINSLYSGSVYVFLCLHFMHKSIACFLAIVDSTIGKVSFFSPEWNPPGNRSVGGY